MMVLALLPAALAAVPAEAPAVGVLSAVKFEQRLDAPVPQDLTFLDETGHAVKLRDYFGDKPVILSLVYFGCPNLCTYLLNGLIKSLDEEPFSVGRDLNVLSISIDPKETPALAAAKKRTYLGRYGHPGAESGWHFLTGEQSQIKQLATALGVTYAYDPETRQFAHPSGLILATPQGRISRYLYGMEFAPLDLKLGLIEASRGRIGSPTDQVLLRCYHYDPRLGRYSLVVMEVVRLAGLATLALLALLIGLLIRRERRRPGEGRP